MGPIDIWMGHIFLENWYMFGVHFRIPNAPPKTKSTPPHGTYKCLVVRRRQERGNSLYVWEQ